MTSGKWVVASVPVPEVRALATSHLPLATVLLERETGIEPATNSLEGCDSTIELLPHPDFRFWIFDCRFRAPAAESACRNPCANVSTVNLKSKIANPKSAGGQGRVRTSVDRMGRQIYSLLLLTTQPPVRFPSLQAPP